MKGLLLAFVLLLAGCSQTLSLPQATAKYAEGDTLQTNLPGPKIVGVVTRSSYNLERGWIYSIAYVSENPSQVTCQWISERFLSPVRPEQDGDHR